ncbi:MAG: family 20 glycosylhydrolase, partial [Clostridia bacterium]|nr:family 20 glycosylhydrolase [Clostridia bacterium]
MQRKFEKLGVLVSSCGTLRSVDTLKRFMEYLAKLHYDTFYLDITAGYGLEGEPFFAYLRAKYTVEEMKELDAHAKSLGITVIPTIQTLAHLGFMFRWPPYLPLRDIDEIMMVGNDRVYEIVEKMIKTMSECFSSKIIHLGMDEAFQLGRGKYQDVNGPKDRVEIMKEHVARVLEICKKYDVKTEMWGDMYIRMAYGAYERGPMTFDKSEEVRKSMPDNVKIHYWDYYSTEKEHYINFIEKFQKITDDIVFDGGVWDYIGYNVNNSYSLKITEAAFEACIEKGIKEATITIWGGDSVNESSLWSTMPTLVAASEYAHGNHDIDKIKARFKELMGLDFDAFMALENADKLKPREGFGEMCSPTKYLLYNDVFAGIYDSTVDQSERHIFKEAAEALRPYLKDEKWGYIFRKAKALAEVMEYKFDLGVRTRKAYKEGDKKQLKYLANKVYPLVIKRIKKFYKTFREYWYLENMQNGFEVMDVRFGGLIQRLNSCRTLLNEYCAGKRERLAELEQKIIDYIDG